MFGSSQRVISTTLTIHQESVLLSQKGWFSSKEVHHEDMIPGTTIVTLNSERPGLVLHSKVSPYGS